MKGQVHRCPRCPFTYEAPIPGSKVWHECPPGAPSFRRRLVALEPVPAEQLTLDGAG